MRIVPAIFWPTSGLALCAALVCSVVLPMVPAAEVGGAVPLTTASPSCTVTWTGDAPKSNWNIAQNWSTDRVPGPQSDVCISPSTYTDIFAVGNIVIHSLQVNSGALALGETIGAPISSSLDATDSVDNQSSIILYDSTLESPRITSFNLAANGPAGSGGTSTVTSPGPRGFTNTGSVSALEGTLSFTDMPAQLSLGRLSGGQWATFGIGSNLVLPSSITVVGSGAAVALVNGGRLLNRDGSSGLALQVIEANASVEVAGNAQPQMFGTLVSAGTLDIGGYDSSGAVIIGGTYTERPGAQTSMGVGGILSATQLSLDPGSSLSGNDQAVIEADLDNAGSIGAGGPTLHIAGNYTQTGTGSMEAGDGDVIAISGHATLAGALETATSVPPPLPGNRSTAVTFASRSGNFTSDTLGFVVVPTATQVDVVAQPQVAVSPSSVAPGANVTASGGDFPFASTAQLYLDHVGGTPLATTRVSFHGFLQVSVAIPASTPAGNHTIIAVDGSLKVSTPLHVL